jgi:hypothetical protein
VRVCACVCVCVFVVCVCVCVCVCKRESARRSERASESYMSHGPVQAAYAAEFNLHGASSVCRGKALACTALSSPTHLTHTPTHAHIQCLCACTRRAPLAPQLLRQYLYFCTSKASKLSTSARSGQVLLSRGRCCCCCCCWHNRHTGMLLQLMLPHVSAYSKTQQHI